ncbi:MAG: MBL fold metallo-hydrolase [bacterium]|nr:MBL fold metallo-hydrolase [bacterium]
MRILRIPKSARDFPAAWFIVCIALTAIGATFVANCSSSPPPRVDMNALPVDGEDRIQAGEAVYLRYLGTGGVLIRWGDRTILTAPYFSGHDTGELCITATSCGFASQLVPNLDKIHRNAVPFTGNGAVADDLPERLEQAEAIFVGHAHYDHLLDVPQIVRCYAPEARVYGSTTAVDLLSEVAKDIRMRGRPACPKRNGAVDRPALGGASSGFSMSFGDVERVSSGVVPPANPRSEFEIRYRAVLFEHAPHVPLLRVDVLDFCREFLQVGYRRSPPKGVCDWAEGQTFAYFLDFLRGGELQFRLYYNDAAGGKDFAQLPEGVRPGSIDLAILTAASFALVDDYPGEFMRVARPQAVFMNHWENFLQFNQVRSARTRAMDPPPPVLFTDLQEFHDQVQAALPAVDPPQRNLLIPDIGAEFVLDINAGD